MWEVCNDGINSLDFSFLGDVPLKSLTRSSMILIQKKLFAESRHKNSQLLGKKGTDRLENNNHDNQQPAQA